MNVAAPVRLVVFDIGGVLVRIAPWEHAHQACGYAKELMPPRDAFLAEMSRLNHAYDSGAIEPAQYEEAAVRAAGGRYTTADVRRIHAAQLREEQPGIGAVFDALEAGSVATGALSNTNPLHWERLSREPEYPTVMRARQRMASFMVGCAKPDPRIYEAFAQAAAIMPSDILFFDDLERNVAGARAAGWRAELVDPGGSVAEQLLALLRAYVVIGG